MLRSVGLGGDGDEVDAIEAAFARFGVAVPVEDAAGWASVGDVWDSLERRVPGVVAQPMAWQRFIEAVCHQTGADPRLVERETRLLA